MSECLTGTVALVTGASSGIGRATAIRLAERGATVAVLARRSERLREVAGEIEAAGGPLTWSRPASSTPRARRRQSNPWSPSWAGSTLSSMPPGGC